jgi:hypothetical protein
MTEREPMPMPMAFAVEAIACVMAGLGDGGRSGGEGVEFDVVIVVGAGFKGRRSPLVMPHGRRDLHPHAHLREKVPVSCKEFYGRKIVDA